MIEVEHLSKVYGSTTVIQDVDFCVNTGEILGFWGQMAQEKQQRCEF